MGIRGTVSRSTLADANEHRDWRIYAELAQALIAEARPLYQREELSGHLEQIVYALDATTIDLALSLSPWATFRSTKAAVKLHTLLDLRGTLPTFLAITEGKVSDVTILDSLPLEPGSIYVMDRGDIDFGRLARVHRHHATFVVRAKRNLQFRRQYSRGVEKHTGLRCDQTIRLTGVKTVLKYPDALRRVKFVDQETRTQFVFLTNNFELPALTIAQLYQQRWRIELFFKWIKQHLKITRFYGTSEQAVNTQIWIAISAYVLLAIIKKRVPVDLTLYNMLQIVSVNPFERIPLYQLFSHTSPQNCEKEARKQLCLFNL